MSPEDLDRDARLQSALLFLRAGGLLSWQDWQGMAPEDRAAFAEAGDFLAAERAALPSRLAAAAAETLGADGALSRATAAVLGREDGP